MTEKRDSKTNLNRVTKTIVTSPVIYKPVGPYRFEFSQRFLHRLQMNLPRKSQAILFDNTLYLSGILGFDSKGQLVCGGAEAQTKQALDNMKHLLAAGGASLESVVKTNVLLARMEDYQVVNQVYAECYQAILVDKTLYVSGILGMTPESQLVDGVEAQTKQALDNLQHVLEAGGASLESVVKTTILLAKIEDFTAVNAIYEEYFKRAPPPARATFQVGKLPKDAQVEIDAIALSGDLVVAIAGPCPCTRT